MNQLPTDKFGQPIHIGDAVLCVHLWAKGQAGVVVKFTKIHRENPQDWGVEVKITTGRIPGMDFDDYEAPRRLGEVGEKGGVNMVVGDTLWDEGL